MEGQLNGSAKAVEGQMNGSAKADGSAKAAECRRKGSGEAAECRSGKAVAMQLRKAAVDGQRPNPSVMLPSAWNWKR